MPINKVMREALKALSYPDIHLKKNYKIVRSIHTMTHPKGPSSEYKAWNHKVVAGDHVIPVRIFSSDDDIKHPVLLFFHGGGWVTGNIDSYTKVCSRLAKFTGHTVISVDYRLAPEHKFPAAPEDCYAVAKEIFLNSRKHFGIGPEDITLIGDSAGGNLAAAVSLMAKDRGEFMPKRQVLIYPAVNNDFSENSQFKSIIDNGEDYLLTRTRLCDYMDLYKSSDEDLSNPYFAPILAEDLSGLPDTLLITAEFDPLRDEGEAFGEKLKSFGNQVIAYRIPDVLHGFFALSPKYPPIEYCYEKINCFVNGREEAPDE